MPCSEEEEPFHTLFCDQPDVWSSSVVEPVLMPLATLVVIISVLSV